MLPGRVVRLPAEDALPDAVFVEDAAIVLDEVAVLTRPGAASRRPEVRGVAEALTPLRSLLSLTAPAQLDGGDVLRLGRTLYVGCSTRTNHTGRKQLATLVSPFGYRVIPIDVRGCLHLKTAACAIGDDRILACPERVSVTAFEGATVFCTPPEEPDGANVLRIGERVVVSSASPRTADLLNSLKLVVLPVDNSELRKAEAGVTCCSLVVGPPKHHP